MTTVLSIIGAIIVLGVLIIVHELGHFGVARALGFRVDEFAVGFGPRIFSKERGGIRYSLRLLPLGGFCKFHGEDEEAEDPECFNAQKAWKRALVVLAGAAMNILFAFVLAVITLLSWGDFAATIHEVRPGTPAETAGVQVGDQILSITGKRVVFDYAALDEVTKADPEEGVTLTVRRNGENVTMHLSDLYDEAEGRNMMGVTIDYTQRRSFRFGEAIVCAGDFLVYSARSLLSFFANIFKTPNLQEQVLGPVGTISVIGMAVRFGWETIFRLSLYLSLNLGIFNLLPFPGLDGGRLIFLIYEMIFKKPIPRDKEGLVHLIGLAILFGFIIYITVGDVRRLFGG